MKELCFEDLKLLVGEPLYMVSPINTKGRNHYFKTLDEVKNLKKVS